MGQGEVGGVMWSTRRSGERKRMATQRKSMSQLKNTKSPFVLALDVGTSSTRALLFDAKGAAVPEVISQRTYKLTISADGEVSVDAEMLAAVVEETIDEVLRLAGPAARQI